MKPAALPGETSFEQVYRSCYASLVGQLFLVTANRAEAEDAVQEAFARLCAKWPDLQHYDNHEAWARRVAINVAISRWRRHARNVWLQAAGDGRDGPSAPRDGQVGPRGGQVRRGSHAMTGCPRMNKEPEFLAAKLRRVRDPHVQPLNELVERWRQEGRQVPYADPDSGRGAGAGWAIGRLTAPGTSPKYCVTSR